MKKKSTSIIILSILFSAIACTTLDDVRTENRENLMRLSQGMSKEDVLFVMGNETQKTFDPELLTNTGKINNPYRIEMYDADNSNWEILFYYTDRKASDSAITDDELTPIVIRDGELVGFGWTYWEGQIERYEIRVR